MIITVPGRRVLSQIPNPPFGSCRPSAYPGATGAFSPLHGTAAVLGLEVVDVLTYRAACSPRFIRGLVWNFSLVFFARKAATACRQGTYDHVSARPATAGRRAGKPPWEVTTCAGLQSREPPGRGFRQPPVDTGGKFPRGKPPPLSIISAGKCVGGWKVVNKAEYFAYVFDIYARDDLSAGACLPRSNGPVYSL